MVKDPESEDYLYTFFLDNDQLNSARAKALAELQPRRLSPQEMSMVYVGYRQLTDAEKDGYDTQHPLTLPYLHRDQINMTAKFRAFVSSCLSTPTDEALEWSTTGCLVSSASAASTNVVQLRPISW